MSAPRVRPIGDHPNEEEPDRISEGRTALDRGVRPKPLFRALIRGNRGYCDPASRDPL
jgi:hypothetical protein